MAFCGVTAQPWPEFSSVSSGPSTSWSRVPPPRDISSPIATPAYWDCWLTRFGKRSNEVSARTMTDITRVGVVGCGLMGSGIAQSAAAAGFDTVVRDVSQGLLDRGRAGIVKSLGRLVEKGKITTEAREDTMAR